MQTLLRSINLILLSLLPAFVQGQIPDTLKSDWNLSGLDSNAVFPVATIDVLSFGVVPDDGLDDRPALLSAFSNTPSTGAILLFPPGTYHFSNTIQLPSNCIIRGAGADSTFFIFNMSNAVANSFQISGTAQNNWLPVSSGLQRGSSTLIVPGAASLFLAGNKIELEQDNGSWDTNPAVWAAGSVGHVSTVTAVSGDSVFMAEALRMDFDSSLNPKVRKINCVQNSGLECFRMTRVDSAATSINYGIYFSKAFNCWVRGVESFKSVGAHVYAETSAHLEVKGCYFHESYTYDGASTHGYGVIMSSHAVLCRIENNVFRKLRHAMMVKQGANGNVFGYNYSFEPYRSEFPIDFGADICLHGHYPFANLFEGNICKNAAIDQAWGPNGPYNTLFRNRIELYGLIISSGTVQSNQQSLVGNDITSTAFFQGQYSLNGTGHFQFGNRVQGNTTPSGTGNLSDSSLYLDEPPAYWLGGMPWPSVGLPYPLQPNLVPAASRYLSGNRITACSDSPPVTTSSHENPLAGPELNAKWDGSQALLLSWKQSVPGGCIVSLFNTNGLCIHSERIFAHSGLNSMRCQISNQPYGILLVVLESPDGRFSIKQNSPIGR